MKKIISVIGILFCVELAQAELAVTPTSVSDDFERTAKYSSSGSLETKVWKNGESYGEWGIVNGAAAADSTSGNNVLINKALKTVSGDGKGFTVRADLTANTRLMYGGIVFNYQSPGNYYAFRYRADYADRLQIVKFVNGTVSSISRAAMALSSGTAYTLEITSTNACEFTATVYEAGTTKAVQSFTATDKATNFTGGYAGLAQFDAGPNTYSFDNFSLTQFPRQ